MELTKRNLTALFAALAPLSLLVGEIDLLEDFMGGIPDDLVLICSTPYLLSIWFNLNNRKKVARGFSAGLLFFPAALSLILFIIFILKIGSISINTLIDFLLKKETITLLVWIICSITSVVFAFQENDEDDADEEYFEELEESHEPQRRWGAIAAGAAVLSFLFLPLGDTPQPEDSIGLRLLVEDPLVLIAIVGLYVLAIFASLSPDRVFRGFGVGVMGYLPIMFLVILLLYDSMVEGFGSGMNLCMICSIVSVVLAFLGGKSKKTEVPKEITGEAQPQEFENKVHQYSDEQLNEMIKNAEIYNDNLIATCKEELDNRNEYLIFRPIVEKKTNEELQAIIDNSEMYKPNMVRCCQVVLDERKKYSNPTQPEKTIID